MNPKELQIIPIIKAAGVIQPPVKTRDAINETFDSTRADIARLEAERDARDELVATWSPAQVYRSAS